MEQPQKGGRMNVIVEQRSVYGNIKFYPVNDLAQKFAALMRQKTFDARNLFDIKNMGVTVIIDQKTISI
jgi:hypothetical protein